MGIQSSVNSIFSSGLTAVHQLSSAGVIPQKLSLADQIKASKLGYNRKEYRAFEEVQKLGADWDKSVRLNMAAEEGGNRKLYDKSEKAMDKAYDRAEKKLKQIVKDEYVRDTIIQAYVEKGGPLSVKEYGALRDGKAKSLAQFKKQTKAEKAKSKTKKGDNK